MLCPRMHQEQLQDAQDEMDGQSDRDGNSSDEFDPAFTQQLDDIIKGHQFEVLGAPQN